MNAHGLQDASKRRALFEQYRNRADIICIQETHCTQENEKLWSSEWGGRIIFANGTSTARGVCIMFKKQFFCNINKITRDYHGRFILCEVEITIDQPIAICTLYAPNSDKPSFFDGISQILCEYCADKIVLGDFNLVLDIQKDRRSSSFNNKKACLQLKEMMQDFQLTDIWRDRNPDTIQYSWHKTAAPNAPASRIDYMLVSRGLDGKCDNVMYFASMLSDHAPLYAAITDSKDKRGPGYWKFNSSRLNDPEFIKVVTSELNKDIMATGTMKPDERWEKIKKRLITILKQLSRQKSDNAKLIISQLAEAVANYEKSQPLDYEMMQDYINTKAEMDEKLKERGKGLIFRSKAKWFREGEKNTRYFYALEAARSNAKSARVLINDKGEEITDGKQVLQEQFRFYADLYTANKEVQFQLRNNSGTFVPVDISSSHDLPFNTSSSNKGSEEHESQQSSRS